MSVGEVAGAGVATRAESNGAGLVELLEGMALLQRLAGLDPRTQSQVELLREVAEHVVCFTGFEDCAVHLREGGRWCRVARAGWRDLLAPDMAGVAPDLEGDAARSGYGFLELVGRGGETVHIPDLGRLKSAASPTCGTLICAPVSTCDRLFGVLCVAHSEAYRFGVTHERLAVLAADIVATKLLCRSLLTPAGSTTSRTPRSEDMRALTATSAKLPGTAGDVLASKTTARLLADLPDRVDLESHLRRALQSLDGHRDAHALCVLDIDQLRVINESCGHGAGDELLRQVVSSMRGQLRVDDVLVRLGGDEFGVLLWDCPQHAARGVVESLRRAIRQRRFQWREHCFRVRASFGVVCVCSPRHSPSELLSAADAACHGAKNLGGDRVHVYQEDDEAMRRHSGDIRWVTEVNRALEDDSMSLHFQPIEPAAPGSPGQDRAFGELLLRMRDASGELVPAGRFLPAAERYGLSTLIDRWVVEKALAWLTDVAAQGAALPMLWVNLSGHSLSDPDFHEVMTRTLSAAQVPGECFCFEITETAAIANMKVAQRFIDALRALGCRFALDDFGSGMSSFAYLKSMNVDFVKIDGTFVRDLLDDVRSLALVRSMNEVAHAMGKLTVAEWVETEAVREALRDTGVDYLQGHLVGRPGPLDRVFPPARAVETPSPQAVT